MKRTTLMRLGGLVLGGILLFAGFVLSTEAGFANTSVADQLAMTSQG